MAGSCALEDLGENQSLGLGGMAHLVTTVPGCQNIGYAKFLIFEPHPNLLFHTRTLILD